MGFWSSPGLWLYLYSACFLAHCHVNMPWHAAQPPRPGLPSSSFPAETERNLSDTEQKLFQPPLTSFRHPAHSETKVTNISSKLNLALCTFQMKVLYSWDMYASEDHIPSTLLQRQSFHLLLEMSETLGRRKHWNFPVVQIFKKNEKHKAFYWSLIYNHLCFMNKFIDLWRKRFSLKINSIISMKCFRLKKNFYAKFLLDK